MRTRKADQQAIQSSNKGQNVDESLIPLTPEEAAGWGVLTKGKAAGMPTIAPLQIIVPVGGVEPEEAEETDSSLEARLDKALAEPDYEREETFRYLKEYRKQKRFKQGLERQDEAREEAGPAVERILQEGEERSAWESEGTTREITSGGAMAAKRTSARSKTSANVIRIHGVDYVQDETGELLYSVPPAPRRFAPKDRARAAKNRDRRHGRRWWLKRLQAISEGKETVTKEQLQAHIAIGRSKGWTRRPSNQR